MPRALFVTTVATSLEAFLLPYAGMLRERGWVVDALACGATDSERVTNAFNTAHDIEWSRRPWELWRVMRAQRRVTELVAQNRYDLVHVHTPVASFVTRRALRNNRQRPSVIYTAHGFHFHSKRDRFTNAVFRRLEVAAASWTDWLVTMNQEDYAAALRFGSIPRDRVRFIPGIGIDCETYVPLDSPRRAAIRDAEGIGPEQFAVAIVGEFTSNKRQSLAVDALLSAGPGVLGVFIGDGSLRQKVEARARSKGVPSVFLGHRRDAGRLIAACDALLHVSRREGVPRVVLEAAASEVPIVGTRTRGTADILGVTGGLIVDPPDAALLGAAVRSLARYPDAARSLGIRGRLAVRETYGLGKVLAQYGSLFDEALRQGPVAADT